MAESLPEKNLDHALPNVVSETPSNLECAVCLQTCVHPAELPCGHVFCYLCIKGIVNQGRRCAMCRQDIPIDFLDKPRLLKPVDAEAESQGFEDGHLWFYEGHNGWWQYDERTSLELETAYQNGDRCCELLVAGFLYVADFDSMLQYRRNDPCRRRRIKRDLATTSKKGVAGLKLNKDQETNSSNNSSLVSNILIPGMQNLHISSRPISNRLNTNRTGNFPNRSVSSNRTGLERSSSETNHRENLPRRRNSYSPTRPSFDSRVQNNANSENEENLYSRNSELDNMIHDTLDWTIQQIESLQLELSNDYENLSQDVDHYERLQNVLDSTRADNETRRSRTPVSRFNRSLENELDLADRIPRGSRSRLNRSEENVSSTDIIRTPSYESDSIWTNIRDRFLMRSRSSTGFATESRNGDFIAGDEANPRLRGMTRMRTGRTFPRRSSSLRNRGSSVSSSEPDQ